MKTTRRGALKTLGATALAPLMKACGPGEEPASGPATARDRIDTVVVLVMENRSFDHVFGARSLLDGLEEDGLTAAMANPRADGSLVAPYRAEASCVADPPHGWASSHRQWNAGQNDGFVREHEARHGPAEARGAMAYLTREEQPVSWALADGFSLCQRWFSSVMGPTWPNRYYSLLGTSEGRKSNDFVNGELPSVFERVYRSGRSYGNYYGNLPFAVVAPRVSLDDPELRPLERFFDDAAAGTLPNLCWLDPIYGRNDDHPPSHPGAGQVMIGSVARALAQSPQWERSLLIVTYDEHGGFFDHVSPPTAADERAGEGFDQLGFRVPSLVVGPYVKEGHVSDVVFDHTSIYATLASLWDLEPLSARSAAASTVLTLLDDGRLARGEPRPPPELPSVLLTDDELYAPECVTELSSSIGFSAGSSLITGTTGQPELEVLAYARFAHHPKNRTAQTDEVYRRFLAIAKDLGAWRSPS